MLCPLGRFVAWKSGLALLCAAVLLTPVGNARASAPADGPGFRRHLDRLVDEGDLNYEQALVHRFQRVFAPDDLPSPLESEGAWPAKSATLLVHEFDRTRGHLTVAAIRTIEGYLGRGASSEDASLETAHFRIGYSLSGADAVPSVDVSPENGIPDLVDWVGEHAETAWSRLIAGIGFTPPVPAGQRVRISFREMSAFGFTRIVGDVPEIILHRDFNGFPENRDPAGSRRGAVKVAVAHELKHASQHAASDWTEGGWLEADATWAEDFVFDEVDDYLRYLPLGSPVSHPEEWLPASYEDCLWSHLLVETHGPGLLVDFFARRGDHREEAVLESFDRVLRFRGSDLQTAAASLALWCYFTGANASGRPVGFREAELYPTPPISSVLDTPEDTDAAGLIGLGTRHVVVNGAGRSGSPQVEFVGETASQFSVSAVILDRAGRRIVVEVPQGSLGAGDRQLPVEWESTALLVVLVSHVEATSGRAEYFLTVDDHHATGVEGLSARDRFRLDPNRPNPFRVSTTISFVLPVEGPVRLTIYDVGGRLVRHLVDHRTLTAGRHELVWEGVDDGGRPVRPGVYFYRLEADSRSATRRLLLLR
jgi:hypothetical protein